jgi:hypothetical protein
MKKWIALSIIAILMMFSTSLAASGTGYSPYIENHARISWTVEEVTNFTMWYTGGGYCTAANGSSMQFQPTSIDDDVYGTLFIGNVSVATNNTMIALDLTLGVWPTWLPGLVVKVGQNNIEALNESAYAAAERTPGNWMNGTMTSRYENISVSLSDVECIVFDYHQDSPGTQITHLAYSLATGVLVDANTTVTFASTYKLVISFASLEYPTTVDMPPIPVNIIIWTGLVGGVVLGVIIIIAVQRRH